jgi:hypothetical protein
VKTFGPFPFRAPVSRDENRAAHGGVTYRDELDGKTRLRNVNGRHQEIGPWR